MVSTPLKNISQIGSSSQLLGKIKNVPNHQPDSNHLGSIQTLKLLPLTQFSTSTRFWDLVTPNWKTDSHHLPKTAHRCLYGDFISHGGTPNHPSHENHGLVLKQPWGVGDPALSETSKKWWFSLICLSNMCFGIYMGLIIIW